MIKFYTRKIGLLAVFLLVVTSVSAQLKITGVVKGADDGQSLPGVSVKIKNATTAVSTDANGRYSITAATDATLTFSYVGYKLKEVQVNGRTNINVNLNPDQQSLTDVVVVGYQQVKRRNSTAALASITSKDIENLPAASVDVLLQGKLPG
ncbi:carboxypeptidase-like regulatory domain-containing protein [Pedobacter fastidiosus]